MADVPRYRAEHRPEASPLVEWAVMDRLDPAGAYCAIPRREGAEERARRIAELLNLDEAGNVLRDWTVRVLVDGVERGSYAADHAGPLAADVVADYWELEAADYAVLAGATPVLTVEVYRDGDPKPLAVKTARVSP